MPNNNQQGFSLLEILIAFSILALSLGILLKIFAAGVNTAIIADNYTTAVQISKSLMAKTGIETPLQIGESTGIENNIYHWRIQISPFTLNDDQIDTKTLPAELFKVKVSVIWGDDKLSDRQLDITTLKLLNKSI